MQPTYKFVKSLKPHCSICGEVLHGNGSVILPYACICGEWKYNNETYNYETKEVELELELKRKENK